jgi:hypothetical protein
VWLELDVIETELALLRHKTLDSIDTLYVLIFMPLKARTAVHRNCRMGAEPDVLWMV